MTSILTRISQSLGDNELLWQAVGRHFVRIGKSCDFWRTRHEAHRLGRRLFAELTVSNGPFQGLRYPSFSSAGSALYPKLIGSYERELHPILEEIRDRNYSEILDIGCAEGYYAVGLARIFPDAVVYAFDIAPEARRLCAAMASLNEVSDRVRIGEACSPATLEDFTVVRRALVICDCEGYEKELFNPQVAAHLNSCDFLIEVHDFVDRSISQHLRQTFNKTHTITVITSIDDTYKPHSYIYPDFAGLPPHIFREFLAENRPETMEWFFCQPIQPEKAV